MASARMTDEERQKLLRHLDEFDAGTTADELREADIALPCCDRGLESPCRGDLLLNGPAEQITRREVWAVSHGCVI